MKNSNLENLKILLVAILSWIIPKKKGSVAFSSFQFNTKYGGNLKPVFQKLSELESYNCIWLSNNPRTTKIIQSEGLEVVQSRFHWSLPMLRAEWVFIDSVKTPLALGRFQFIQLWHGTGFKNIGIENKNTSFFKKRLIERFGKKTKLLIANSEADKARKIKSLSVKNTIITGSPRLDSLFTEKNHHYSNKVKTIAYLPTYRESSQNEHVFSTNNWDLLDQLCSQKNWSFLVKFHPSDKSLSIPDNLEKISDVTPFIENVQELILKSDLIISDYSGVVTDAVAIDKPVIWYIPDLHSYLSKCRDFYYDFPDILPGPFANNFSDLLSILNVIESKNLNTRKYEDFKRQFHAFSDEHSTLRVIKEFTHLMNR